MQGRLSSEFKWETIIHELMSVLGPVITTLQPEAVDSDHLMQQLSQAVKPHISQLFDLTFDKQEAASLIVNGTPTPSPLARHSNTRPQHLNPPVSPLSQPHPKSMMTDTRIQHPGTQPPQQGVGLSPK